MSHIGEAFSFIVFSKICELNKIGFTANKRNFPINYHIINPYHEKSPRRLVKPNVFTSEKKENPQVNRQ
ncbi:hypothetical protein SAMN05661012_04496 [Chitinophaga sancti]|uniref:Uncharacterized protein n=1 Tax=Chitinophaga sancti TaxID=1004 RepID=A0A1K1RYN9_9BACT|nr:hypothetical protein SAMN05661012_04496 [Chitinophaga sancti]